MASSKDNNPLGKRTDQVFAIRARFAFPSASAGLLFCAFANGPSA